MVKSYEAPDIGQCRVASNSHHERNSAVNEEPHTPPNCITDTALFASTKVQTFFGHEMLVEWIESMTWLLGQYAAAE